VNILNFKKLYRFKKPKTENTSNFPLGGSRGLKKTAVLLIQRFKYFLR